MEDHGKPGIGKERRLEPRRDDAVLPEIGDDDVRRLGQLERAGEIGGVEGERSLPRQEAPGEARPPGEPPRDPPESRAIPRPVVDDEAGEVRCMLGRERGVVALGIDRHL